MTPTARTIKRWIPTLLAKEGFTAAYLAKKLKAVWEKNHSTYDVLHKYDRLMHNFGIEHVYPNEERDGRQGILYSNTGDTYAITLTFDYDLGKFRFDSWGSYVERHSS